MEGEPFSEDEFFQHQELWRHLDIHSNFAETKRSQSLRNANDRLEILVNALHNSNWLIITLGTAWSYYHKDQKQHVGHNHRLPGESFDKKLLSVAEIQECLSIAFSQLTDKNPNIRILITVSPVRHLRDGLHENNLSKSTLLLATQRLVQQFDALDYFPAYEILNDELRDYRFFKKDLAHPNEIATDYIWEKLASTYLEAETRDLCHEVSSIRSAMRHRSTHSNTNAHREFQETLSRRIDTLGKRGIDVRALFET